MNVLLEVIIRTCTYHMVVSRILLCLAVRLTTVSLDHDQKSDKIHSIATF